MAFLDAAGLSSSRRLAALLVLPALAGCERPSSAPFGERSPEVWFAGCAAVRSGPVCDLSARRRLTLWVAGTTGVEVRVDGHLVPQAAAEVKAGRRIEVVIPHSAERLAVEGPGLARWTLELGSFEPPGWYTQALAAGQDGNLPRAQALAEPRADAVSPLERGLARHLLAAIAWGEGALADSERHREAAIDELEAAGLVSLAQRNARALTHQRMQGGDLGAARELMTSVDVPAGDAEAAAGRAFYLGQIARLSGDLRTAMRQLALSSELAHKLDLADQRLSTGQMLGLVHQQLGLYDDAARLFDELAALVTETRIGPCEELELVNNRAWTLLLAAEAGRRLGDPLPALGRALELVDGPCTRLPAEAINVRLNLALAHLQMSRLDEARRWLERARDARSEAVEAARLPRLALWQWELEARLRLLEAQPAEALALYDELVRGTEVQHDAEALWRLELWRARSLEALGRSQEALAAHRRADDLLDRAIPRVPMHQGRTTFIALRDRAVQLELDLLLRSGNTDEALALVRRARSRYLRSLRRFLRISSLSSEDRRRWDEVSRRHREARDALDSAAAELRLLPSDERRRLLDRHAARYADLQDRLDAILGELGDPGGRPPEARPIPAGELVLTLYPAASGWVVLAADGEGAVARSAGELEPLLGGDGEELATRLLVPFAHRIARAERIRILSQASAADVDFHALPLAGKPLLVHKPVVYGLDLPLAPPIDRDDRRRGLVVGDPTGNLAGSRAEVRLVERSLRRRGRAADPIETLRGSDATGPRLRRALAESDWLHYAGHAAFDGWDSYLPLAEQGRLTVDDVLALPRAPAGVVLSGCDTGRSRDAGTVAGIGLGQAFLISGSRFVIAPVREVDDLHTALLMERFYQQIASDVPPDEALRSAQLALRDERPDADWAAFRVFVP